MKKFTLFLCGASITAVSAFAHGLATDSVLISKHQQGDKIVEKYLLPNAESDRADFEILFPINVSALQQSFADNTDSVAALYRFMERAADTTMHIRSVMVVGYASPDGLESKNVALAQSRAAATTAYLKQQCNKVDVQHSSVALKWSDCVDKVKSSSLTNKEAILAILNSTSHTELQKQAELEKLTEAWKYFKNTLLPSMRKSDINIDYAVDKYVEKVVTVAPKPAPQPAPAPQPSEEPQNTSTSVPEAKSEKRYPVAVVETEEMGIIVEVPQKEHRHRKNQ